MTSRQPVVKQRRRQHGVARHYRRSHQPRRGSRSGVQPAEVANCTTRLHDCRGVMWVRRASARLPVPTFDTMRRDGNTLDVDCGRRIASGSDPVGTGTGEARRNAAVREVFSVPCDTTSFLFGQCRSLNDDQPGRRSPAAEPRSLDAKCRGGARRMTGLYRVTSMGGLRRAPPRHLRPPLAMTGPGALSPARSSGCR